MASPIREGTSTSTAFSSRDINIAKEIIHLKIDNDFNTAKYVIEYFIKTDIAGKQVPLLFYAKDYNENFKVWVDDVETEILDIPAEYTDTKKEPFQSFSNSFSTPAYEHATPTVTIYWQKNYGNNYEINELKYFEPNLSKGEHKIRVEYEAEAWTDVSDWIKEYSFRYSLSPAKYWKSFGTLEITVDAVSCKSSINTNLGKPTNGKLDSIAFWKFDTLPADFIIVSHIPKISQLAELLIAIDPFGLTILFAIILIVLHFFSIKKYRKNNPSKKYSLVVIIGSLVIPFIVLFFYVMSYGIIDNVIGVEAGRRHGYTFLVIIFYPILLVIYWLIMWLIDRKIKANINIT